MRAAVYQRYGPPEVLKIRDLPKPTPQKNELLIRVRAATVTSGDARMRRADPFLVRLIDGFIRPRKPVLGFELAGEVEAVGPEVTRFRVGDRVFGSTSEHGFGAHAEYKCQPEESVLARMAPEASFEEAACLFFGGHSALHFLRAGGIREGHRVLIYGASGCLGTYAVQLARHFGAKATGVCSTAKADLVHSLGAHRVIDYTTEDFSQEGPIYDLIFDTVGKCPYPKGMRSLKERGIFLDAVHLSPASLAWGFWVNTFTKKKVIGGTAAEKREDLVFLRDLAAKGVIRPVIDRVYPLERIVEAHAHVDQGHKTGNVVITL